MPASRIGRITFQGREYASPAEMPPAIRQQYEQSMSAAANQPGLPNPFEPGQPPPYAQNQFNYGSELQLARQQVAGCRRWLKRAVWIGLILTILSVIACFALIQIPFRSSESYDIAWARARASAEISEVFGQPIKPGWWVLGEISSGGGGTTVNYQVPISGPRQQGSMNVVGSSRAGIWHLTVTISYERDGQPQQVRLSE